MIEHFSWRYEVRRQWNEYVLLHPDMERARRRSVFAWASGAVGGAWRRLTCWLLGCIESDVVEMAPVFCGDVRYGA